MMVFSLEEGVNEDISTTVNELLQTMEEKPCMEDCRVGIKKVRPVKITIVSSSVADQRTAKVRKLNSVEKYKKVFVNPDRSPEQRKERRELVKEVKRLSVEGMDKRHYIRNVKVYSVNNRTTA